MPTVYIVIVNWNGWRDTLECLESLFKLEYKTFHIVVVDNDSNDDSVSHILHWLTALDEKVSIFKIGEFEKQSLGIDSRVTLILNDKNLGFASANNIGMRFALRDKNSKYIWILNNDTIVDPLSLNHLVSVASSNANIGMTGGVILDKVNPEKIMVCAGGTWNKYFASTSRLGNGADICLKSDKLLSNMDYIAGAHMLVSRQLVESVGLMREDLFLYCEEIDWAIRAKKNNFSFGFAANSYIQHKGSSSIAPQGDLFTEYYFNRNKLLITRDYYPVLLLSVYVYQVIYVLYQYIKGRKSRAKLVLLISLYFIRGMKYLPLSYFDFIERHPSLKYPL